jgi:hypothetical protein
VVRGLNLYADMHRFIAILTMPLGATIREVEVRHHPRIAGHSKYGISRVFSVLVDLFTIQMLTSFSESPLRWFALLGLPFLLTAVLTANTFLTCLFMGLLGEFVVNGSGGGSDRRMLFREWRKKL